MTEEKPLILITNDDGVNARGIHHLVECVAEMGDVIVVAPSGPQSGQSSAITVNSPLYITKHDNYIGAEIYSVNGTPVDCIKLAMHTIVPRRPDLVLSGINHGANSGNAIIYSGTMGAALEACMLGIDAIGYSYLDHSKDADFSPTTPIIAHITKKVIKDGLPKGICLNVNIPAHCTPQGIKVVRAARGFWTEEYQRYENPIGHPFYMLTGTFTNNDPQLNETDNYWLDRNYATVVPVIPDQTAVDYRETIKNLLSNEE